MVFTAKLEPLPTGEVSLNFSNDTQTWEKVFSSLHAAAKEAERLGVFDSATRKLVENVAASAEHGYIDTDVKVQIFDLRLRGFEQQ